MTYLEAFPEFDPATLPAIPASWDDNSWRNNTCPSWATDGVQLEVFINYADPTMREVPGCKRFAVLDDANEALLETDDWDEVLSFVLAEDFAKRLREWLSPDEFAEMKRRNETDPRYAEKACASHDFCDANDAMDIAWRELFGEDAINADDEKQAGIWNRAWEIARQRHLGHQ